MSCVISLSLDEFPEDGLQKGQKVLVFPYGLHKKGVLATFRHFINYPCVLCGEAVVLPEEGQSWCWPCRKDPERQKAFLIQEMVNPDLLIDLENEGFACPDCGYIRRDLREPCYCEEQLPTHPDYAADLKGCERCDTGFIPKDPYQVLCLTCTTHPERRTAVNPPYIKS